MKNKSSVSSLTALFSLNFFLYGLNALYYSFMPVYLDMYHTNVSKGILLSVGPVVSVIAPIFWGKIADKSSTKNRIVALTIILSAAAFFSAYFSHSFLYLFIIFIVIMFFMSPFGGLVDTITLEYSSQNGVNYGPIRLMGTIGYGLIAFIISLFTANGILPVFVSYIVIAAIAAVSAMMSPSVRGHAQPKQKLSLAPIFRDKGLMLIFAFTAISYFVFSFYQNFYSEYVLKTLGLPDWVWGLNVFLTITGEIPFFIFFGFIMKKLGKTKVIAISFVITVIRCFALAFAKDAFSILTTAVLTGFCVTPVTYCASVYINEHIPENLKASGQSVMYAFFTSIPRIISSLAGGFIVSSIGVSGALIICGIISAISLLLLPLTRKYKIDY
ncbi:MAG: MFS transporter [Oscillospiraceae bacterium]|nr:MFS transporter [Oscillospiraceae bacterium]